MQWHLYEMLRMLKYLYPYDVRSCSVEQVMSDHCSLSLLTLSFLGGDFPRVERQLCISAGCFAFG